MKMSMPISGNGDVIEFFWTHARRIQTVLYGHLRKTGDMLDATESFFFDRGDEFAITKDRRRRIAVVGVNAKYVQNYSFYVTMSSFFCL